MIRLLQKGQMVDVTSNSLVEANQLITAGSGDNVTFRLLDSGYSGMFTARKVQHARALVSKGTQRERSIALGYQRTGLSPKEIFNSVCRLDYNEYG